MLGSKCKNFEKDLILTSVEENECVYYNYFLLDPTLNDEMNELDDQKQLEEVQRD